MEARGTRRTKEEEKKVLSLRMTLGFLGQRRHETCDGEYQQDGTLVHIRDTNAHGGTRLHLGFIESQVETSRHVGRQGFEGFNVHSQRRCSQRSREGAGGSRLLLNQ